MSTVNLGCKLDLKTIALRARNAEYNPKVRYNGEVTINVTLINDDCLLFLLLIAYVTCLQRRFLSMLFKCKEEKQEKDLWGCNSNLKEQCLSAFMLCQTILY